MAEHKRRKAARKDEEGKRPAEKRTEAAAGGEKEGAEGGARPAGEERRDGEARFLAAAGIVVAVLLLAVTFYAVGRKSERADLEIKLHPQSKRSWREADRGPRGEDGEGRWRGRRQEPLIDLSDRLGVDEGELEAALREHREAVRRAHERFRYELERLRRQLAERLGVEEEKLRGLLWLGGAHTFSGERGRPGCAAGKEGEGGGSFGGCLHSRPDRPPFGPGSRRFEAPEEAPRAGGPERGWRGELPPRP